MHARSRTRPTFAPFACAALALTTLGTAAHAQTFFPNNATLDVINPVSGDAIVGYANQSDYNNGINPTSPTVHLVSGGSVGHNLAAYNSSIVNMSGGNVSGSLAAFAHSTLNVSGGSIGIYLDGQSSTTINISGGSVGQLFTFGVANISGGNFGAIEADPGSTVNIFGAGLVATIVTANNGSNFTQYSLSGLLANGTPLVNEILYVANYPTTGGSYGRFTLNNVAAVPEPGSVALLVGLTTVVASLLRRRRIRK